MKKVFISYSHKDEEWKDRLTAQLKVLELEGRYELWDEQQIRVGEDWLPEIEKALDDACVVVMIVSADFLVTKFIRNKQVPRILERRQNEGLHVFPIIVRPCPWKSVEWLSSLAVTPEYGEPLMGKTGFEVEEELSAMAEKISRFVKAAEPLCMHSQAEPGNEGVEISFNFPIISSVLFGRDKYIDLLDKAWENPRMNVVSFVAWGGVGKTALVNRWLAQMVCDNYRGADRVYGWSFYSQGAAEGKQASADRFVADALGWFGDPNPAEGSPGDRGKRLVSLIRKQRTLLILDGLEPLQHPPGHEEGRIKDIGLRILLRDLALQNPGLCIITTRLKTEDISNFVGASAERIELEHLTPDAGAMLIEHLGVKGTGRELRQAAEEFDGHALALNLLGTYLVAVCNADVRERDKIDRLAYEDIAQGKHARWVMESYEKWLETTPKGRQGLNILRIMGLFDRPAELGAIQAVRAEPKIEGLTDDLDISHVQWKFAVQNLRELRLITKKDENRPDTLDCHPLVREHFGEKLRENSPDAWKEAHGRLYEYYKNLPGKELPDTLEEMEPLFAAVAHGCQAGRHQEAEYDVYWKRIKKKEEHYCTKKLGAFGVDLAALFNFFEIPWSQPVSELTDGLKATVLGWAGFSLRALGRLREAVEPMQAGLEFFVKQEDWKNAAGNAGNLSELCLTLGEVKQTVDYARQSVDFADRSRDAFERESKRTTLADALHQAGDIPEVDSLFREAETIQKESQPEYPFLYSLQGFRFCDLLLSQGQYREVQKRVEKFFEWRLPSDSLLSIALEYLSLGRAHLLQAQEQGTGDFTQAKDYLNQAVDGLREYGSQQHLPRGLLARSALYRTQQKFSKAWNDLEEVLEIAERGSMGRYLADYHLEATRLHLAQDQAEQALDHLEEAEAMIKKMGYGRRKADIEELNASLDKWRLSRMLPYIRKDQQ
ncbi:MAG: TIR domain-containing protein [Desulfobacteraceae bacterium]|nr:TIR domain-containing protein [Desulfobacteraceae bacterium]